MAKRRKTYRRYSPYAFITGLLCFGVTALIVTFFFVPCFGYEYGAETASFNGFDFLMFGIRKFVPIGDRFDGFTQFFQRYIDEGGESYLLKPICQFHEYLEMVVVFFYAASIVLAVIEAILGLFWFITGRLIIPKSSKVLAWIVLVFVWVSIGLLIGYMYIYAEIIKALEEVVVLIIAEMPFILGTLLFLVTLAMSIIYAVAYKGRRLVKKVKPVYDDEPAPVPEQPSPAPTPVVESAPQEEAKPQSDSWTCPYCGSINTSKFCTNCGAPKNGH